MATRLRCSYYLLCVIFDSYFAHICVRKLSLMPAWSGKEKGVLVLVIPDLARFVCNAAYWFPSYFAERRVGSQRVSEAEFT